MPQNPQNRVPSTSDNILDHNPHDLEYLFKGAEEFANSDDPDNRLFGAWAYKELYKMMGRLIVANTDPKMIEELKRGQENIRRRIEEI